MNFNTYNQPKLSFLNRFGSTCWSNGASVEWLKSALPEFLSFSLIMHCRHSFEAFRFVGYLFDSTMFLQPVTSNNIQPLQFLSHDEIHLNELLFKLLF